MLGVAPESAAPTRPPDQRTQTDKSNITNSARYGGGEAGKYAARAAHRHSTFCKFAECLSGRRSRNAQRKKAQRVRLGVISCETALREVPDTQNPEMGIKNASPRAGGSAGKCRSLRRFYWPPALARADVPFCHQLVTFRCCASPRACGRAKRNQLVPIHPQVSPSRVRTCLYLLETRRGGALGANLLPSLPAAALRSSFLPTSSRRR